VFVTLEMLDTPPPALDNTQPWTAVTELSFESTSSVAWLYPLMGEPTPPFDLPAGSGWYRVRAHAFGRELDFDAVAREPRETPPAAAAVAHRGAPIRRLMSALTIDGPARGS